MHKGAETCQHTQRRRTGCIIIKYVGSSELAKFGFATPAISLCRDSHMPTIIGLILHGRQTGFSIPETIEVSQSLCVANTHRFGVQAFIASELNDESFSSGHLRLEV